MAVVVGLAVESFVTGLAEDERNNTDAVAAVELKAVPVFHCKFSSGVRRV